MRNILDKINQLQLGGRVNSAALECIRYRGCTVGLLIREDEARAAVIHFCESLLDAGCGDLEMLSMALNKPIHFKLYTGSTHAGIAAVIVMENGNTVVVELETHDEASPSQYLSLVSDHIHTHEGNTRLGGNYGV
jgi:hypothetical protein